MGVAIIQYPSEYTPAYNPNYYLISGTNSAQPNYKLIARISNASGDVIATLKTPTDPTYTSKALFDVHRIIENYLSHTIDIDITKMEMAANNNFKYNIEFGEQYGTTATDYYYSVFSSSVNALNIALSPKEWNSWDKNNYLSGSSTRKMLCKYEGTRKVFTTSKGFMYFLQSDTVGEKVNDVLLTTYDVDGNVINTAVIINSFAGTNPQERVIYFPSAPYNLNQIPQAQLTSGTSGNIVQANCSYYTLQVRFSGSAVAGKEYRFDIIDNCTPYTNYPIYFLGQYGNVELWNFNRKSFKSSDINRSTFRGPLGKFLTANSYGYENTDRQLTQYNTEVQDKLTLNSDNLTESEVGLMKELLQSPQVWVLQDGELIPVMITDNVFEEKIKANEKVFNLTINIEFASITHLQRY